MPARFYVFYEGKKKSSQENRFRIYILLLRLFRPLAPRLPSARPSPPTRLWHTRFRIIPHPAHLGLPLGFPLPAVKLSYLFSRYVLVFSSWISLWPVVEQAIYVTYYIYTSAGFEFLTFCTVSELLRVCVYRGWPWGTKLDALSTRETVIEFFFSGFAGVCVPCAYSIYVKLLL